MGRAPCCDKASVKRGPWSPEEDAKLKEYIETDGIGGNWIALPQKAGLRRCGKSCRLRWLNYLRPDIKHGDFSEEEDRIICNLYASIGSRWSIIAAQLPGRTDNDIKNYWNTKLKKKFKAMDVGMGRGKITAQRNSNPHQTTFSFLQTASSTTSPSPLSSSCLTSYLSYNISKNTYESMQTASSITGLEQLSISRSCLLSNVSSHSSANSSPYPPDPRVKESGVFRGEASCSSSDGSTMNNFNQVSHCNGTEAADKIQNYICNDGVEKNQNFMAPNCGDLHGKASKSTGSWLDNCPFDFGLEEIKQLINTSSCNSSFLFDDNNME